MKNRIAQVVVGLPVEGPFDYLVPEALRQDIRVGHRVLVSFQTKKLIGFVVGLQKSSRFGKLKEVSRLLDPEPVLSEELLWLAREVSVRYCCAWGEAIETALPRALKKSKKTFLFKPPDAIKLQNENPAHKLFFYKVESDYWPFLTQAIQRALSLNQSVVMLVPETSQVKACATKIEKATQEKVIILDKKLTSAQELIAFKTIQEGDGRIVIGTRSAIFAPVHSLGLIIVLEEDGFSYKQDQTPFYDARDVAVLRAEHQGACIYFCSQAPTPERMHLALQEENMLEKSLLPQSTKPEVVDLLHCKPLKSGVISLPVQYALEQALAEKKKILLFMNKKGFSSYGVCSQCGHALKCPRCDVYLTYIYHAKSVNCRYCSYQEAKPESCPHCHKTYLHFKGTGIEKLESEAARYFPSARIVRYDGQTQKIPEHFDILIATQSVLHLYGKVNFGVSVVVQADAQLDRPDYQAGHEAFALFSQIHNMTQGRMLLQTRLKNNYCLAAVSACDPESFYSKEIKLRKDLSLPPFGHVIEIVMRGVQKEKVQQYAQEFFCVLTQQHSLKGVDVFEPQAAAIEKLRDQYRFVIVMRGKPVLKMTQSIKQAFKSLRKKSGVLASINVDP